MLITKGIIRGGLAVLHNRKILYVVYYNRNQIMTTSLNNPGFMVFKVKTNDR